MEMKKKILWITQTGVLLALLVVLQGVTKPLGQFVTGSCVNAVLAVAVLTAGIWSGLAIALISPFVAFLFGIGPQVIAIVPAIAVGNAVYVTVIWLMGRNGKLSMQILSVVAAAAAKALTLYLIVVQLLCRFLPLKPKQIETFTQMFSWPQLVTALIGGAVALAIYKILKKALKK